MLTQEEKANVSAASEKVSAMINDMISVIDVITNKMDVFSYIIGSINKTTHLEAKEEP